MPVDAANDDTFAIRLDDDVSSLNWLATTSVNRDAPDPAINIGTAAGTLIPAKSTDPLPYRIVVYTDKISPANTAFDTVCFVLSVMFMLCIYYCFKKKIIK